MNNQNKANGIMHALKYIHFIFSVGIFCIFWFLFLNSIGTTVAGRYHIFVLALFSVFCFLFIRIYNGYMVGFSSKSDLILALTIADVLSVIIAYAAVLIVWSKLHSPLWFLVSMPALFIFNLIWVRLADKLYFKLNKPKKAALIYRNARDLERLKEIEKHENKFEIVKVIENPIGDIQQLEKELAGIETIFVAGVEASFRNGIAKYCVQNNVEGYFLPHVGDILMSGAKHVQAFSVPLEAVKGASVSPEYAVLKRLCDILISFIGIIICSPILLIVAGAIVIDDHGPVLYKQVRLTKGGKEFKICKFRSMRTDAEKEGKAILAKEDDDRVTKVGKFIRACRIDELPQLFNILKGDMSLVGPRPERPEIAKQYAEELPTFELRLQVKAGLTGYAQVYGRYNTDAYDKLQFDLLYITHMSLIVDLQILVATFQVLFKKESTEGF